jgi:hypothetical protein
MTIIRNTNLTNVNDLIFYLDAVNPRSYPRSGSVWYDLSSNGNHFTLFNSPTYVQNGTIGTYLTFNGTNQYARSANAINFNAYSAVTIEIGYRSTVTNATQILYETTGTGGSTITGGISLLMNADSTGTVANVYLSQWQGYGSRLFGYTVSTNSTFNSVVETFVNGVDSSGRSVLANATPLSFQTTTNVVSLSSATTAGLSFANTWTFVASRSGTGNFFRGDIAYIRAWGRKLVITDLINNHLALAVRQPVSYQLPVLINVGSGGSLYEFTSATFTSGGQTGRTGPALSAARTGLTGVGTDAWKNNTEFFNTADGIQIWTVPKSGTYRIEAWGAQGGNAGGLGARMRGDFVLTGGESIRIIVGQQPTIKSAGCNQGGGGGTFVWRNASTTLPLIVAGGGGGFGNGCGQPGQPGTTSENGTGSVGAASGGNGGAPGGAGWNSNGGTGLDNANNGNQRPLAGGNGGFGNTTSVGDGGFGGGSGASGQSCGNGGAGGGGGYSGGGGPSTNTSCQEAGGGGSFNAGTTQSNTGGVRSGSGQVQITLLS